MNLKYTIGDWENEPRDSLLKLTSINLLKKETLGDCRRTGYHNRQIMPNPWSIKEEEYFKKTPSHTN